MNEIDKMQVETWSIDQLVPYAGNPRKNDHAVEKMADLIERFGFWIPILAKSSGDIVDGHLRFKAALHLGLKHVPVIVCDGMTEEEIKAFRISVNKAAELADWDLDLLQVEFETLEESEIDISITGFDELEVDEMFGSDTPFMNTPPPLPDMPVPTDGRDRATNPPEEFDKFDDDINYDYCCPKCGYIWSGAPRKGR